MKLLARALTLGLLSVASALAEPAPLRFFPAAAFDGEGDSIQSGVRVSRGRDGSVRIAPRRFDSGGAPRGLTVPTALGGGYLFHQPLGSSGGAGTALFRAATFTGELQPLGTVPFVVSSVQPGFDRLYLLGSGRTIAIDPETGNYMPLDPLPPVATILDLSFDDDGRAFLRAPLVGELVSEDSGLSWTKAPELSGEASVDPAESQRQLLNVITVLGQSTVFSEGTILRLGDGDQPSFDFSYGAGNLPRQGRLLEKVVLRGGIATDGAVVALVDGERVSFDPVRGAIEHAPEVGLDPRAVCQALPPGEVAPDQRWFLWFACVHPSRTLELRAYGAPASSAPSPVGAPKLGLALTRTVTFPKETRVLAAGRLGVLVGGACPGQSLRQKAGRRALCLATKTGDTVLHAPPADANRPETFAVGSRAVNRLSLLADGGIQNERLDAPAAKSVHRLHHETELESLVFSGSWLPFATVFEEGISFWATHGESYVGVRLERDSTAARVGAIQRPLRRAFFSGKHALAWGASGFARISVDGGMTFAEVNYPFVSGDADPSGLQSVNQALTLGCGPAGCSLGTWVSVGWGAPAGTELETVPPRIAVPPLGGGRFRFVCAPTGESSPPSLSGQDRVSSGDDVPPRPALAPAFWDRAPPRQTALEATHSVGDHRGLGRLYATGPKEGSWGSRGRVLLRFRSSLSAGDRLESLDTTDLFTDEAEAQARLGVLDRMTQSAQTELDPGGEAGVMLVRTRQQATLFAFADGAGVQRFDAPEELGLLSITGAVLVRGRFYVGQILGGDFRILALEEGGPVLVGTFPLGETGPREAVLTRSTQGDLGIAIDGDLGLLVYPVSRQGELGDALFQPFRGSRPPECPAAAAGYLVVRELSIAPYVEVSDEELDVSRVTMRRVVGFGPECIDALAADARGELDRRLFRAGSVSAGGTSLVVTDRSETGRRVELSCH